MTGLEALARILPQHGRGLTMVQIEAELLRHGIDMKDGRLAGLLHYLESYEMVERDGDRYLQAQFPPEVKL